MTMFEGFEVRDWNVPGATIPDSTKRPKATRGADLLSGTTSIALSSSGSVDLMRCNATFT